MAKKTKRQARSSVGATTSSVPTTYTPVSRAPEAFTPDYTPVIKDLRRIGILAGTFFTILIVLAFLMPAIQPLILR